MAPFLQSGLAGGPGWATRLRPSRRSRRSVRTLRFRQALASAGTLFVPLHAQTNNDRLDNRTDIYATLASFVGVAPEA